MSEKRGFAFVMQSTALVLLAAALAGFVYLFGFPGLLASPADLEDRKEMLQQELHDLQQQNDFTRRVAGRRADYLAYTKTLEVQFTIQLRIIPEDAELDSFQTTVKKDAAATPGLQVRELIRLALVARGYYVEQPFQAHVEGRYDAMVEFFQRLQRHDRLITVSRVTMTSPYPRNTPNYRIRPNEPVDANCVVSTYFVSAGTAPPSAPVRR